MAVEVGFEAGIPRYNEVLNVEDVMPGTRAGRFVPTPMLASAPRSRKDPLLSFVILSYPVNHQHVLFEHVCCHCSGPRQRYVPGCVGFRQFPEEARIESAVANISVLTGSAELRLQYAPYLLIYTSYMWRVSRCVPW
jgi:hypothetical protein